MSENAYKLLNLLSEVFKVDVSNINDETSPENLSAWDSFNTLKMIMELENEFNVKLPLEDVVSIKSVKDIKSLLSNKGVDL
jgi:acyl carrier protein